jgi:hypothetical protein
LPRLAWWVSTVAPRPRTASNTSADWDCAGEVLHRLPVCPPVGSDRPGWRWGGRHGRPTRSLRLEHPGDRT